MNKVFHKEVTCNGHKICLDNYYSGEGYYVQDFVKNADGESVDIASIATDIDGYPVKRSFNTLDEATDYFEKCVENAKNIKRAAENT